MIKRFNNVQPSREKPSFFVYPVCERDEDFLDLKKSSDEIPITAFEVEEPFLLWNPEYAFCPDLERRYPVILGDWNLNFSIFLQNIDKFSIVFCDGVGSRYLEGKIPPKVIGVPIFALYVNVGIKDDVASVLKSKKIDVLFIGNLNPGIHEKRNRLLKRILTLPENYKVVVASGLYNEDIYSHLLSSSKIIFNFSVRREMNMRVFEALKTAACLFLEDGNIETWEYLEKFKDAVPYTEDNFAELITRYLQNDDERERVTISGYERIKDISKSVIYKRIWNELAGEAHPSRDSSDVFSKISSFRSFVNHLFNFPICINEQNLNFAESWCLSLANDVSKDIRPSLLSDLSFLFLIAAIKMDEQRKQLIEKSMRYLISALAFEPGSLLYWYNMLFLNYSSNDMNDFKRSCSHFFKTLLEVPLNDSMKDVRGFPQPFCPFIFTHYTVFKSYIDQMWFEHFSDTDALRKEISKALSAQVYVFLANFALANEDYKEAENFCMRSMELFPEFSQLYYLLGKIKMRKGEFKDSASIYLKAYEMDPFFFGNWVEVLSSLILAGDKDKFNDVLKEMKRMSRRIYVYNGLSLDFSVGSERYNIAIKSIPNLINEYILKNEG